MDKLTLTRLSATDAARSMRDGAIDAYELAQACLERAREVDGEVNAWAYLDAEHVLAQAGARDADRREGRPTGPLHGVPVAVQDVFDTADMPTENGSALHAGRMPAHDATAVARLREAGAVMMGKTRTSEFAADANADARAEGEPPAVWADASLASAAAVASGAVPLALGSQTAASVIGTAAACGVFGFKPTYGLVARGGLLGLAPTLDQPGVFARCLEDVALMAEQLAGGEDARDPATRLRARVPFVRIAADEPPLAPLLAFARGAAWEGASDDTRDAFAELFAAIRENAFDFELPASARSALAWHRTIVEAEMAAQLDREWNRGGTRMSQWLRAMFERGREVKALDYQQAVASIAILNAGFDPVFERCDAIVAPAARGSTWLGPDPAADAAFSTLWTLCGMPAISLPLLRAGDGQPMGVQLIGRRGDDARLLRTAGWLMARLQQG